MVYLVPLYGIRFAYLLQGPCCHRELMKKFSQTDSSWSSAGWCCSHTYFLMICMAGLAISSHSWCRKCSLETRIGGGAGGCVWGVQFLRCRFPKQGNQQSSFWWMSQVAKDTFLLLNPCVSLLTATTFTSIKGSQSEIKMRLDLPEDKKYFMQHKSIIWVRS